MIDAVIVGSGPNGLSAGIVLAQAGCEVVVFEANDTIGGGVRSAALTLPGFVHDVCSAVHPFAVASPFWRTLPLAEYGLEWIQPPLMLGHPFDDGSAAVVERSIDATSESLGADADAYRRAIGGVARDWPRLERAVLGPPAAPRHPVTLARFGFRALRSAEGLANSAFREPRTRAMFGGIAAHGMAPLNRPLTAGVGLALNAMCHVAGWPIPRGGAQQHDETHSPPICDVSAAGLFPPTRSPHSMHFRPHGRCSAISRRGRSWRLPALDCPAASGGSSSDIAMVLAPSKWTGRCRRQFRGQPRHAAARARSTSAARCQRSRILKPQHGLENLSIVPMCC